MPGELLIPLISAGLQAGGLAGDYAQSRANMRRQDAMNRQQQDWNLRMYFQQRSDALRDWSRQNQYNSPEQQMQRFKEAGLNPNLIYGNAAAAGTSPIRSSNASSPNVQAPQMKMDYSQLGSSLASFQDATLRQVQTDNLRTQGELMLSQKLKTDMQTANEAVKTERGKFDLNQARDLKDLVVEKFRLANANTAAQTSDIFKRQEFTERSLDQRDIELQIKQQEYRLKAAKTDADINKINEDILRSIVMRTAQEQKLPLEKAVLESKITEVMNSAQYAVLKYQLDELKLLKGTPEYYKRYAELMKPIADMASSVLKNLR